MSWVVYKTNTYCNYKLWNPKETENCLMVSLISSIAVYTVYVCCSVPHRCSVYKFECSQSANAEEAGDSGELSAGGGGGPCAGVAGLQVSGWTNCHWAHPAAPEPTAALCKSVGCSEGTRVPVPWTWWVLIYCLLF